MAVYKVIRALAVVEGFFPEGSEIESRFFKDAHLKAWEKDGVIEYVGESEAAEEEFLDDHTEDTPETDSSSLESSDEKPPVNKAKPPARPGMTKGRGKK